MGEVVQINPSCATSLFFSKRSVIFIEELAYSFHIGSDKNKKNISRANGKNNVILNKDDKEKIINYIDKVDNTNQEYKKINELSLTLKNVDIELKNSKILAEENNALKVKNAALVSELENKKDD